MADHDSGFQSGCDEYRALSRRAFVKRASAAAAVLSAPAWLPRITYADTFSSQRDVIVSIFLRGGADGLTLVPPVGEDAYYTLRPTIAIPRPDSAAENRALDLDGFFGLPAAMGSLLPAYNAGHLLIVHATGSIDPTKSHFDAQNYMEVGVPGNISLASGWLGRHLATRPPVRPDAALRAIGFSYGMPRTLAGAPLALPIPNPASFGLSGSSSTLAARLDWLTSVYQSERDPLKTAAVNTQRTMDTLAQVGIGTYQPAGGAIYPTSSFATSLRSTAALIRADIGVEAVQIDIGGWDTHSAQGPLTGSMASNMRTLADALAAFHLDMVGSNQLQQVTLVAISEFGRVARENASQGTDHGHGNCLFLMGGAVNGRQVLSNWPGLNPGQLYQNQDLHVTIDYRDILAEVVQRRLGNSQTHLVFPDYTPTLRGVVR